MRTKTQKKKEKELAEANQVVVQGKVWKFKVSKEQRVEDYFYGSRWKGGEDIILTSPNNQRFTIRIWDIKGDRGVWPNRTPLKELIKNHILDHPELGMKKAKGDRVIKIGDEVWFWQVFLSYSVDNVSDKKVRITAPTGKKSLVKTDSVKSKLIFDNCRCEYYGDYDCDCETYVIDTGNEAIEPRHVRQYIDQHRMELM